MLSLTRRRTPNRCVVCDAPGDFPYDARFDGAACDVCNAMLTIRDDIFRREHPEHEDAIRTIWRDLDDPTRARDIGRMYAAIGYFDEQEDAGEISGPDDRLRRLLRPAAEDEDEDDLSS